MEKGKTKKKESGVVKGGSKATKKKTTIKKTEKSAKKKKTGKKSSKNVENDENNKSNINNGGESVLVDKNGKEDDNQNIEDKLNQPLTKKKLPPIEKNNEIENENEEEIKEEEKKEEEKEEVKYVEMSIGTPYFYNIEGLKNQLEKKNNKINEENNDQENYKTSLNNLLNDLNRILSENVDLLYNDAQDEQKKKKQENINYLQNILFSYQQQIKDSKEKNKLYKQHYELLYKKDENIKMANVKEYEALIEEKKNDNNILNKKIIELKQKSRVGGKKLEKYSENVKYPQDINNLANQLKTLSKKKADYFSKLNNDIKTISIYQKELKKLEEVYANEKEKNNYLNAKVEEDISRIKDDLTGNTEEIYNKVQNDKTFIQKKQIHQEKVNSVFNTKSLTRANVNDIKNMKLKKGTSLEPFNRKAIRYDVRSGYNTRRLNIVAKNKSPIDIGYDRNKTKENVNVIKEKDILEEDLSNINYNNLTDFEYRELLTKKEHYYDVTSKLEKSIKEAQKMYIRKIKELKVIYDDNYKKLTDKKQENNLLQSEINDLKKILSLTEKEAIINSNKNDIKIKTNTNNNAVDEKELESHKEYLSPEYYQMNKNKNSKDKTLIPTHSNNDLTGNELLNDLKGMNENNSNNNILLEQGGHKLSNLGMKFPDLSNIEEDKGDKMIRNNEFDRNKVLDDIKKKYNIKKSNNNIEDNDNNEIQIDDNELNFDEINERKKEIEEDKEKEKENEDEKKFFKEHEDILKQKEEEQFEPPIDNNVELENNNEIEDINEIKDIENDNQNKNNLIASEQLDKDHVNIKKEEEENNINNNENRENEDNKKEDNIKENNINHLEHQDDIIIEGTKNENEENKEENLNEEKAKENGDLNEEEIKSVKNENEEINEIKGNEELREEEKKDDDNKNNDIINNNDNLNAPNEDKDNNDKKEVNENKEENKAENEENTNIKKEDNNEEINDEKKEEIKKEEPEEKDEKKEDNNEVKEEKEEKENNEEKKEEEKKEEENKEQKVDNNEDKKEENNEDKLEDNNKKKEEENNKDEDKKEETKKEEKDEIDELELEDL